LELARAAGLRSAAGQSRNPRSVWLFLAGAIAVKGFARATVRLSFTDFNDRFDYKQLWEKRLMNMLWYQTFERKRRNGCIVLVGAFAGDGAQLPERR